MKLPKTFRLIPEEYRPRGIFVIVLSVARALFDLVGLAVLVPILILVLSPEGVTGNRWLSEIYSRLGFTSDSSFTWAVCAAVVLIIVAKGGINLAISRFQNRYLMSLYRYYAQKMLDSYYRRGLLFIKSKNSAKLAHQINYVSLHYVQAVPMNIAGMTSDILLMIMMLAAILFYSPVAALMVFVVFIPIALLYMRFIRRRLNDFGRQENEVRRKQARIVQEAFRGYPEIEVNDAFPQLEKQFGEGLEKIAWYRRTILTASETPGAIMETGIAVTLSALVLLRVDAVLLGIFGVVALRMLPAVRNIVNRWMQMHNANYAREVVEEGIRTPVDSVSDTSARMEFSERITIKDLSFCFDESCPPVIDNLSLEIHKGERLGIKGASGGGKTTLFNLLLGLYPPTAGQILIDDTPLVSSNRRKWQNIAGYVPQEVFIMDSSIAENVSLGGAPDRDRVMAALKAARLGDFVAKLPEGPETMIGEGGSRLSGGQKQRIGIARALYKNAEVLFFDEATSSLDSRTEREINEAIKTLSLSRRDLTIVIIAHRESSLAFCDRIIEIG